MINLILTLQKRCFNGFNRLQFFSCLAGIDILVEGHKERTLDEIALNIRQTGHIPVFVIKIIIVVILGSFVDTVACVVIQYNTIFIEGFTVLRIGAIVLVLLVLIIVLILHIEQYD